MWHGKTINSSRERSTNSKCIRILYLNVLILLKRNLFILLTRNSFELIIFQARNAMNLWQWKGKIEWLFEGKWAGLSLVRILMSFLSTSEIEGGRPRRRRKEFMSHRRRPDERKSEKSLTTTLWVFAQASSNFQTFQLTLKLNFNLFF